MTGYCLCGCGQETTLWTRNRDGSYKGPPRPYVLGHNRRLKFPLYDSEDRGYKTPCKIWRGNKNKAGYGTTRHHGRSRLAHRVLYAAYTGQDVDEFPTLDHLCRVHPCVDPTHMEEVSHLENVRRGDRTKLNPDKVRFIRESTLSDEELSLLLHCIPKYIGRVRRGRCWKDVPL